jgi:hypothetical protein
MNLEERSKYRRLLAGNLSHNTPAVENDAAPVTVGAAAAK